MKLTELIRQKLDEPETEEDGKLREAAGADPAPFVEEVMESRVPKEPGTRGKRYRKVTYRTMVLRAQAAGHEKFSKVTLSKIMTNGLLAFPTPDTIFALAAALRVSPEMVTAAVAAEFGIRIYQPDRPDGPVVLAKGRRTPSQLRATARRITQTLDLRAPQGEAGDEDR